MANEQNLIPINKRAKSVQRKIRSKGGKARAKKIQEKKLLSQMYAEFLARKHDVVISGKREKVSGQKLVDSVISKVLSKGKSESVSMLKEIREATEGSKLALTNSEGNDLFENGIKISFEESKND